MDISDTIPTDLCLVSFRFLSVSCLGQSLTNAIVTRPFSFTAKPQRTGYNLKICHLWLLRWCVIHYFQGLKHLVFSRTLHLVAWLFHPAPCRYLLLFHCYQGAVSALWLVRTGHMNLAEGSHAEHLKLFPRLQSFHSPLLPPPRVPPDP